MADEHPIFPEHPPCTNCGHSANAHLVLEGEHDGHPDQCTECTCPDYWEGRPDAKEKVS